MNYSAHLPDRAVLAISGEDAESFLQGLITNDIRKASETEAIFAALLSPQGKFLFDFFIIKREGQYLFDTDKARLPELIKRLGMYRLRSKVEFAQTDMQVAALWGDEVTKHEAQGTIAFVDPRLPELGWRMLGTSVKGTGDYEKHRLSLAVPDGAKDLVPDRSLPMEYGYDELHAIDYAKGCYVGQEVTARTKHRATLRKFIHSVTSDDPLPPLGTPVMANGHEIGQMATSYSMLGLALLRVDESNGILMSGESTLTARLPMWRTAPFAESIK